MAKISETYRNFGWQYGRQRHLYYIVHIDNVPSILAKGVRSHNAMSLNDVDHKDVSLAEVQRRRANVSFERLGTKLHDYANVYFDARNPMMYYLKCHREDFPVEFCALAIDYGVLDLEGNIPPEYILGAYVPTEVTRTLLRERCFQLKTAIRPDLFFL